MSGVELDSEHASTAHDAPLSRPPQPGVATSASPLHTPPRSGLSWPQAFAGFLLLWGAITLWRWEIVASPPYWDSAMGLFIEANFLAENNFDYERLWRHEKRFLEGGPGVYLISVMPTLVALVMRAADSRETVFIVGHLFTFAVAAALGVALFGLLRGRLGAWGAALVVFAVLTTPIFAVQIDMLGMDMPVALLGVMCVAALVDQRYAAAAVLAMAAFLIKQSGGLLLVAAICLVALLNALEFVGYGRLRRQRVVALGGLLAALALALTLVLWAAELPSSEPEQLPVDPTEGMKSLRQFFVGSPTIALLLAICAITALAGAWRWWRSPQPSTLDAEASRERFQRTRQLARRLFADRAQWTLPVAAWLIIGGAMAGLALTYTIPRYLTLPIPMLLAVLGLLLFAGRSSQRLPAVMMIGLIAVNLVQLQGRWLPSLASGAGSNKFDARTGALLERSREYLADHRANLELARRVAALNDESPVVTSNPFTYFFSYPCLGYVERPLRGYSVNTFTSATIRPAAQLPHDLPRSVIVVRADNRFVPIGGGRLPRPGRTDTMIVGRSAADSLLAFRRAWPPALPADELRFEVVGLLWPDEALSMQIAAHIAAKEYGPARLLLARLIEQSPHNYEARLQAADLELAQGHIDSGREILQRLLGDVPSYGPAQLRLADLDAQLNNWSAAAAAYDRVLANEAFLAEAQDDPPTLAAIYFRAATAQLRLGDHQAAAKWFSEAARLAPTWLAARQTLGKLLVELVRLEEAAPHLAAAVTLAPRDVDLALLHARVLRDLTRDIDARAAYEALLTLEPGTAAAHYELGLLLVIANEPAAALSHFRQVMALAPGRELATLAATRGAWILAAWPDAALRDPPLAVQWAEGAVAATRRRHAGPLDALAAAHATQQHWDEALATIDEALALSQLDASQRAGLIERRALYQQHQPFLGPPPALSSKPSLGQP